jgi:ribosomal silencing factor RsfS
LIGVRSLISQAAGSPVLKIMKPRTRKVHAIPTLWRRASRMKLITVPPSPPPA